jgi:DNA polymerase-3 subunit delta
VTDGSPRTRSARARGKQAPPSGDPVDTLAFLVRGEDPSLVAQAARALLEVLVGSREPALVVEEHGGAGEDLDIGAVLDACTTPPFLVDLRVVVVREAGRMTAADGARLAAYLGDPLPSTRLVLVAGGGTVPQAAVGAVSAVGQVIDASPGRDRRGWVAQQARSGPVRVDAAGAARLSEHLGDDLGRLEGILQTLAAAYGEGATVGVEEIEPFLGEEGGVPRWDLTDAIDAGTTAPALRALRRLSGPGGRGAPELVSILARHFSDLLRLDGPEVASAEDAAALLGIHPYPAKKALAQARRLGSAQIGEGVALIAGADLDVKGETGLPPELVLEVLVARLCRLTRARAGSNRR